METFLKNNIRNGRLSSYPTYEEWKLVLECFFVYLFNVLILPMRNGNFVILVTRVRFYLVLILPMRNGNCNLSYWRKDDFAVLILPLRNGNPFSQRIFITPSAFLSYLWGMETLFIKHRIEFLPKFLSYLWGMETRIALEEVLLAGLGFLSYLWGMETILVRI